MPYTLQDLLAQQPLDSIRARHLSALQGAGFPAITEWLPKGGVEMAYVDMICRSIAEMVAANVPDIAASGFLDLANRVFQNILASEFYQLERIEPTFSTFNLQLVSTPDAPPYNFSATDVVVIAPSGNRYTNSAPVSIQPGETSEAVPFIAVAAGASYADDPAFEQMSLVTRFAGLTVQSAAATFGPVVHSGGDQGQVLPFETVTGVAPAAHTFVLRIDITGAIGAARYSVATDGGPFVDVGALLPSQALADGTSFEAVDSLTPPDFIAGQTYTIVTPGGPNFVQGTDEQTNAELASLCRGRWSTLSLNPRTSAITFWARQAYPPASRIAIFPDPTTAGQIDVAVADSHGPINVVSAAAIEAFITGKLRDILLSVRVVPATAFPIFTVGTVFVTRETKVAVQQAAQEAWLLYLGQLMGENVYTAELEQAIMDAGAVDVSGILVNGQADRQALQRNAIPVDGNVGGLAAALLWSFA